MSSINILNRCTASHQGGGLPFYDNQDYVFSKNNNGFNAPLGLWSVPPNKVPTFQIFVPALYDSIITFQYLLTKGGNVFTGVFNPPISSITSTAITVNGVAKIVYQTSDSGTLLTPAPEGRYLINLVLADSATGTQAIELYSEEFMAADCC
jgi:hypothetical protein